MKTSDAVFEKQQQLIINNMALVTYCIKKYIYLGDDEFDDIFQEGCVGLVKAARNFNEELGYKFSTYAIGMIVGTIKKYKREKSNRFRGIHISRNIVDDMNKLNTIMHKLKVDEITAEVIAESGLSMEQIEKTYLSFISKDQSIDVGGSEKVSFEDMIGSSDFEYAEVESEDTVNWLIEEVKKKLKESDFDIFEDILYSYMIGGEKITQMELALRYGVSQAQISRKIKSIRRAVSETYKKV